MTQYEASAGYCQNAVARNGYVVHPVRGWPSVPERCCQRQVVAVTGDCC